MVVGTSTHRHHTEDHSRDQRLEIHMTKFLLGVAVTLAVLYPAVTKDLFGKAVDTTNAAATNVIRETTK